MRPMKDVGIRIRQARESRGLTQRRLGIASDVPETTISRIERGENHPRLETAYRLAKALELPVEELLGYDPAA